MLEKMLLGVQLNPDSKTCLCWGFVKASFSIVLMARSLKPDGAFGAK